ncbi:hypothetical protein TR70_6198 [Burkholderia pseudomallei]|nr:hypothetical protein TR70_6198 [Burkholderia pseudomallei]
MSSRNVAPAPDRDNRRRIDRDSGRADFECVDPGAPERPPAAALHTSAPPSFCAMRHRCGSRRPDPVRSRARGADACDRRARRVAVRPRRYRTPPLGIRDRTIRRNMPHMPRATCIPHVERRRNLAPPCVRYAGEYRSRYRGHDIRGRSPRTHRRSAMARPPRSAGYAFERIAERSRQACRSGRSVGAPRARSARLGASSAHPCTPHGPRSSRHDRIDAPRSSSSSRRTLRWQCASFSQ